MNIKEIKEMISLMNENGLVELEIEKDGMRIRLRKIGSTAESFGGPIVIERENIGSLPMSKEISDTAEKSATKAVEIKAPMVGTFYR